MIKTKTDLKMLYINFHNAVNIRKGKPTFSVEEANAKYEKANVKLIIEYFFQIYGKKTINVKKYNPLNQDKVIFRYKFLL